MDAKDNGIALTRWELRALREFGSQEETNRDFFGVHFETLEQRVTERTEELARSYERLRQAERLSAIGQMMTGLSHESRNALQRSLACLELVEKRLADQPGSPPPRL